MMKFRLESTVLLPADPFPITGTEKHKTLEDRPSVMVEKNEAVEAAWWMLFALSFDNDPKRRLVMIKV